LRGKNRARRLLLEPLEARQLLFNPGGGDDGDPGHNVNPGDIGTIWETFPGNYLPPQEFKTATPNFLSAPNPAGDKVEIAINYLKSKAASYGALATDFERHFVTDSYTDEDTGLTHVYLQQQFNGLRVADSLANVTIDSLGRVVAAGANFVRNLGNNNPPVPVTPAISAMQALTTLGELTGRHVHVDSADFEVIGGQSQKVIYNGTGASNLSSKPISMELHYVPKEGGGAELAWKINGLYPDYSHNFEASVGAMTNFRVGQVIRLWDNLKNAAYNVFRQPTEGPADGPRHVAINPHSPLASPFGWHDMNMFAGADAFDLRGNNTLVREDLDGNLADGTSHFPSQILEFNDFFFPYSPPVSHLSASLTNAFYWVNLIHDISFHHGFNEVSGNFQLNNRSFRGDDADALLTFIQSPIALNNAFYLPTPDGEPSTIVFGLSTAFAPAIPLVDISLDSDVIIHEYGHGISIRLTGGPANSFSLDSLQSGGMGEGWSDWLATLLTIDPGDTKNTPRATGEYSFGPGGIRRQPYSSDLAINPRTLDDFNGIDPVFGFPNSEVHAAGEIWAQTLLDLSWLLIDRYGFDNDWYRGDGGNNLALKLVLTGMKLQPANPSFLEARDAIIAADLALTGGANYEEIWTAFARRGFGLSANDGPSAASDIVVEAFDRPPPLSRVSGKVFADANHNNQINASDTPLAGWTVYVDTNNNNRLDASERSTVTAADGSYTLPLGGIGSSVFIREVVQPQWRRILPTSGEFRVTPTPGSVFVGRNFLNGQDPGSIEGVKFNDLNANGIHDPDEPGIAGVMIYVDVNKDGRIGILEPSATTGANGFYRISNVEVGSGHTVREVAQPGLVQTFPDPDDAQTLGGAHVSVTVSANAVTSDINFGNRQSLDWGDAPDSYGTLVTSNGPRHGIVTGYGLTLTPTSGVNVVDGETNGQPSPNATGDDNSPALSPTDENGVLFLSGLTPGASGTVRVGVRTAGFSSGVLQAWVDFNRDGDFLDPNEQIIRDRSLGSGIHNLQFAVPAGAQLGTTFARFRYGIERGIGPKGAALAGEVEDYQIEILQDQPIAVNDVFPDLTRVPPDPFLQLNSVDNPLDVLRNDFGTSTDSTPEIVATDFTGPGQTLTTTGGGTVRFQGPTLPLLYTPRPGATGNDSFMYRVTAGGKISAPATVSLRISPSDPIALDDIFRVSPGATNVFLDILANDLVALNQGRLVAAGSVVPSPSDPGVPANPTTLTITPNRDGVRFTSPAGFTGTVRYEYTIDDGEPSTTDSSAFITIQVTPSDTTPAASHAAIFSTRYLDENGELIDSVDLENSPIFFVELVVTDPVGAPLGLPETTGVASAYVDMLVEQAGNLVEPVLLPDGRFDITFNPRYSLSRFDLADFSEPGVLNEIGATHDPNSEPNPPAGAGNDPTFVMRVKFRALQSGTVTIQADHADSPNLPVLLFNPADPFTVPIEIFDEQVFIEMAPPLDISVGGGEGEFTNPRNAFDVNDDDRVNPIDIIAVINDLTTHGVRPLDQLSIAIAGALPAGYLDTNVDSVVNVLDVLGIINYITASFVASAGGGSGEGESVAIQTGAPPADGAEGEGVLTLAGGDAAAGAALTGTALAGGSSELGGSTEVTGAGLSLLADESDAESADLAPPASEELLVLTTSSAASPAELALSADDEDEPAVELVSGGEERIDSEAADELFGRLTTFRQQLRARK
jgi:hypothetical protein